MRKIQPTSQLPKTLKYYGRRLRALRQDVLEMKHYWKIRCAERKTLTKRMSEFALLLNRMKSLEHTLAEMCNRKHFVLKDHKAHKYNLNNQYFPLFLSHNDITRLRQFLGYTLHKRFIEYRPGRRIVWLDNPADSARLKYFVTHTLKRRNEK